MKKILLILVSILALNTQTMAYEEANYEIVKEKKNYEIRKYPDRLVIETNSVKGNGFRKLFNYISGNNEENEEIKLNMKMKMGIKNEMNIISWQTPNPYGTPANS